MAAAKLLAHVAGAYLPIEVTQVEDSSGANHGQQLMLQLPPGLSRGSVQIEIAYGSFISQAVVSTGCEWFAFIQSVSALCNVPDPASCWLLWHQFASRCLACFDLLLLQRIIMLAISMPSVIVRGMCVCAWLCECTDAVLSEAHTICK